MRGTRPAATYRACASWAIVCIGLAGVVSSALAQSYPGDETGLCMRTGLCPGMPVDPVRREGFALQLSKVFRLKSAEQAAGTLTHPLRTSEDFRAAMAKDKARLARNDDPVGLVSQGNAFALEGKLAAARGRYDAALKFAADGRDGEAEAAAIGNLGVVLAAEGRYDDARAMFLRARRAFEQIQTRLADKKTDPRGDAQGVASPYDSPAIRARVAEVAEAFSREGAGAGILTQALKLGNLGALVDPASLRAAMAPAIEAYVREGAAAGIVRQTINLANVAGHLGQYREAEAMLREEAARTRSPTQPDGSPFVMAELAALYRKTGRADDAARASRVADDAARERQRARDARSPDGGALNLPSLMGITDAGTIALGTTAGEDAPNEMLHPLDTQASQDAEVGWSRLRTQAETAERAGDRAAAITAYDRAALLMRVAGQPERERIALVQLQRLSEEGGDRQGSIFFGKRAVNVVQQLRGAVGGMDRQARQAYVADPRVDKRPSYVALARLLLDAGRLDEAEQVLRLLKEDEGQQFRTGLTANERGRVSYTMAEAARLAAYESVARRERALEDERAQIREESPNGYVGRGRAQQERARIVQLERLAFLVDQCQTTAPKFAALRSEMALIAARPAASRTADERKRLTEFAFGIVWLGERYADAAAALVEQHVNYET